LYFLNDYWRYHFDKVLHRMRLVCCTFRIPVRNMARVKQIVRRNQVIELRKRFVHLKLKSIWLLSTRFHPAILQNAGLPPALHQATTSAEADKDEEPKSKTQRKQPSRSTKKKTETTKAKRSRKPATITKTAGNSVRSKITARRVLSDTDSVPSDAEANRSGSEQADQTTGNSGKRTNTVILAQEPRKRPTKKSKFQRVQKDIQKLQSTTNLLIRKLPFSKLVRVR
jgi:hypothetical protein